MPTSITATDTASASLVPEWISAISSAAGVILALVALIVTVRQVVITARQIRGTAEQEARNSEERTRPYVSIDIVPSLAGGQATDLVVTNQGRATARGVRVEVKGHTFGELSPGDVIGPALGRLLRHGFDLAPGTRKRFYWHIPASPSATPSGDLGAPDSGVATVAYSWQAADDRPEKSFQEHLEYDLTDLMKLAPVPWTGPKASSGAVDEHVKNAVHGIRAIAQNVGEQNR